MTTSNSTLVDHIPTDPHQADDDCIPPLSVSMSGNGGRVAFTSRARDLVTPALVKAGCDNAHRQAFVWNRADNTIQLVSRATGAAGDVGNGRSETTAISADGRYVVFESTSTNLDASAMLTVAEVYVRDLQTQTTTLVSRASGAAGEPANPGVNPDLDAPPSVSSDGRYIAFASGATNLTTEDCAPGGGIDVFIRDQVLNTTTLVSRATQSDFPHCQNATGVYGNSTSPVISADGSKVAFLSAGRNLAPFAGTPPVAQLYVTDSGVSTAVPPVIPPVVAPGTIPVQPAPLAPPPPPAVHKDTTAPALHAFAIAPSSFAVLKGHSATAAKARLQAPHRGAAITFTASEACAVRYEVLTRKKPKKLGTIKHAATKGHNRLAFSGIVGGHPLPAGRYTLKATATDAAGNASRAVTATFTIAALR